MPTDYLPGEPSAPHVLEAQCRALSGSPVVRQVLDSVPLPAIVVNEARETLCSNARLESMLRLDGPGEIVGRRVGAVLACANAATAPSGCGTHDRCRACGLVRSLVAAVRTGRSEGGFASVLTTSGEALEMEVYSSPLHVEHEDRLFLMVLRDVSAERRREWLERVFLHDIQNSAGGLRGLLGLAEDRGDTVDPLLLEQADALLDEIRAQRDILRVEAGDWEPQPSVVRLDRLLARLVSSCARAAGVPHRRVWIEGDASLHLDVDGALLGRVLHNMLRNALEATPAGEVVRVSVRRDDDHVRLAVHNPGAIPAALQRTLFLKVRSTKGPGRGVGTYSMRLVAERYLGGAVTFQSTRERGTTFELRLPGAICLGPAPAVRTAEAAGPAPVARMRGGDALVVDDVAVNRLVARRLLERLGFRVLEASGAREADVRLAERRFDLALVDLELGDQDGTEVIRRLREAEAGDARRTLVAAVTAHDDAVTSRRLLEAGSDRVLPKPLSADALAELLRARHAA